MSLHGVPTDSTVKSALLKFQADILSTIYIVAGTSTAESPATAARRLLTKRLVTLRLQHLPQPRARSSALTGSSDVQHIDHFSVDDHSTFKSIADGP